jgi:hypothetical protein
LSRFDQASNALGCRTVVVPLCRKIDSDPIADWDARQDLGAQLGREVLDLLLN